MNDVIIIIPSRLGSTRLPKKPLAKINGKEMILHVYENAVKANAGDVFVACSEIEVKDLIEKAGGRAIMTDPLLASGTDRVQKAAEIVDPNKKYKFVVNIQGDLPNIDPNTVKSSIEAIKSINDADITTPVAKIVDEKEINNSNVVKPLLVSHHQVSPLYRQALYFSRSTIPFGEGDLYHHVGLYAYRREALDRFVKIPATQLELRERLEQLRALENGMKIYANIIPSDKIPVSVDTQEDLDKAIKIMSK